MRLICSFCGRDLNAIYQDNMSPTLDMIICEDCSGHTEKHRSMDAGEAWALQLEADREFDEYMKNLSEGRQ